MNIKVRPFAELIEGTRPGMTLEMCGFIRGDTFVIAVLDREFELRACAITADQSGAFALLDDVEQRLDFGAVLRISAEYELDMPPGGEIELVWEQFPRSLFEATARAQGIDTERVHLVVPALRSVSVYFDHDGNVSGRATLG